MRNVLTADDNCNYNFYQGEAHKIEGDKHRQEVVFDKGGLAIGLPKTTTSPTINPEARQRQRNQLKRLTAGFLRSGGKVIVARPANCPSSGWQVQITVTLAGDDERRRFESTPLAWADIRCANRAGADPQSQVW